MIVNINTFITTWLCQRPIEKNVILKTFELPQAEAEGQGNRTVISIGLYYEKLMLRHKQNVEWIGIVCRRRQTKTVMTRVGVSNVKTFTL